MLFRSVPFRLSERLVSKSLELGEVIVDWKEVGRGAEGRGAVGGEEVGDVREARIHSSKRADHFESLHEAAVDD